MVNIYSLTDFSNIQKCISKVVWRILTVCLTLCVNCSFSSFFFLKIHSSVDRPVAAKVHGSVDSPVASKLLWSFSHYLWWYCSCLFSPCFVIKSVRMGHVSWSTFSLVETSLGCNDFPMTNFAMSFKVWVLPWNSSAICKHIHSANIVEWKH